MGISSATPLEKITENNYLVFDSTDENKESAKNFGMVLKMKLKQ